MPSSVPPPLPLPSCYICDLSTACNVSRLGNDVHVELCPDHQQLFVSHVRRWLQMQRVSFGHGTKDLLAVTLGPPPLSMPTTLPRLRLLPDLAQALDEVPSNPHGGKADP